MVMFLLALKADLENVASLEIPEDATYCISVSAPGAICRLILGFGRQDETS
jgi:hypothetical protein